MGLLPFVTIYTVPASGDGPARRIATLDRDAEDIAFAWPQFFPDNRRFLYHVRSLDAERAGVYVGDLRTKITKPNSASRPRS